MASNSLRVTSSRTQNRSKRRSSSTRHNRNCKHLWMQLNSQCRSKWRRVSLRNYIRKWRFRPILYKRVNGWETWHLCKKPAKGSKIWQQSRLKTPLHHTQSTRKLCCRIPSKIRHVSQMRLITIEHFSTLSSNQRLAPLHPSRYSK